MGHGEGEIEISEQQPLDEEETDIVHDLHEAPVSATLIQGNLVDRENMVPNVLDSNSAVMNPFSEQQMYRQRMISGSGARSREYEIQGNFNEIDQDMDRYSINNRQTIDEQHQEETFDGNEDNTPLTSTTATKFTVNLDASYRDVTKHIVDINRDFKESVTKKVHTMKLND